MTTVMGETPPRPHGPRVRIPLPVVLPPEPPGDPVQRLAVRLSLVALVAGGVTPLLPMLWPASARWLPLDPAAHARAMTFGFVGLFVLGFLFRIVPRGRVAAFPRPKLAAAACVAICVAAVLDGAGAMGWTVGGAAAESTPGPALLGVAAEATGFPLGRLLLSGLWTFVLVALLATLGVCWRGDRRPNPWVEGWVGAGLASMVVVGAVLAIGPLAGGDDLLANAPGAFMFGALIPVTVGLGARMVPALSGVGPVDRDAVARVGAWMPIPALALTLGLLGDAPAIAGPAGTVVAVGILVVARAMRWLRLRPEADALELRARMQPAAVALRWLARAAWTCLALAQIALVAGAAGAMLSSEGASPAWVTQAWIAAVHLAGLGFLGGMMFGVGQRVMPAFVKEEVRWPRLRHAAGALLLAAVALRVLATVDPATAGVTLPAAMLAFLAAAAVFAAQVSPTLHKPGRVQSPCPPAALGPGKGRGRLAS